MNSRPVPLTFDQCPHPNYIFSQRLAWSVGWNEAIAALSSARSQEGYRTISTGYQDVFNAIAAAVKIEAGNAIGISVEKFLANIPTVPVTPNSATSPSNWADRLRAILKERSKGEQNTWGFVAAFMDMIEEVEKENRAEGRGA
jgi:hypothetical protein